MLLESLDYIGDNCILGVLDEHLAFVTVTPKSWHFPFIFKACLIKSNKDHPTKYTSVVYTRQITMSGRHICIL